jgi:hypothetical protein
MFFTGHTCVICRQENIIAMDIKEKSDRERNAFILLTNNVLFHAGANNVPKTAGYSHRGRVKGSLKYIRTTVSVYTYTSPKM